MAMRTAPTQFFAPRGTRVARKTKIDPLESTVVCRVCQLKDAKPSVPPAAVEADGTSKKIASARTQPACGHLGKQILGNSVFSRAGVERNRSLMRVDPQSLQNSSSDRGTFPF